MELAYGLTGGNIWHGTPINPRVPDRFPGGSSCGSAAAVAARLVDFALGSDTAGIPANYCRPYGIRPTEVTLPAATVKRAPAGLSLIAEPGLARGLLEFACDAADVLGLAV